MIVMAVAVELRALAHSGLTGALAADRFASTTGGGRLRGSTGCGAAAADRCLATHGVPSAHVCAARAHAGPALVDAGLGANIGSRPHARAALTHAGADGLRTRAAAHHA